MGKLIYGSTFGVVAFAALFVATQRPVFFFLACAATFALSAAFLGSALACPDPYTVEDEGKEE